MVQKKGRTMNNQWKEEASRRVFHLTQKKRMDVCGYVCVGMCNLNTLGRAGNDLVRFHNDDSSSSGGGECARQRWQWFKNLRPYRQALTIPTRPPNSLKAIG